MTVIVLANRLEFNKIVRWLKDQKAAESFWESYAIMTIYILTTVSGQEERNHFKDDLHKFNLKSYEMHLITNSFEKMTSGAKPPEDAKGNHPDFDIIS